MSMVDHIQNLRNSRRIEFSAISGYNYYYLPEEQPAEGPIYALHAQSDTVVYLVSLSAGSRKLTRADVEWHKRFILKPMTSRSFEWPVDLLQCKNAEGKYVLYHAFAQRAFLDYVPIKKLMYQRKDSKVLDWRNQQICRVCRSFLKAMQQLDESDYVYNDFNIERIIYQETTGNVILRYTPHTRGSSGVGGLDELDPAQLAGEFAPAYLYGEDFGGRLPACADYYSVAAILFQLMIGRLPYEGRGLANHGTVFDPIRDVDALNHNHFFQFYHRYPHFIFDRKDESNRLSSMQENDLPRERWEQLPEELKTMFRNSLCESTATRLDQARLYSPAQWLKACNTYCWNTSEFGGA